MSCNQACHDYYSPVRPQKGVGHTFSMSKCALGAGKGMMMHCHHLDWTMMHCRQVDVPPIVPSLADEEVTEQVKISDRKGKTHNNVCPKNFC